MGTLATRLRVVILALVSMLLFFGLLAYLADWLPEHGEVYRVRFSYAGPLHPGARVRMAGQTIGRVSEVRLLDESERSDDPTHLLEVRVVIQPEAVHLIGRKTRFVVTTRGVLGEHYVDVIPGPPGDDPLSTSHSIDGEDQPRTDLVLASVQRLVDGITDVMEDDPDALRDLFANTGRLIGNLDRILARNGESVDQLITGLSAAGEGIAQGVGDGADLAAAIRGLRAASDSITTDVPRMATDISQVANGLGTALTSVDSAAQEVDKAAAGINTALLSINALLSDERGHVRAFYAKALGVVGDLNGLTKSAKQVLAAIDRREGLVGALIHDPEPLEDFKELLHELRKQPWKLVWKR
ncbi:MAG: MlaD family protein [Myxococcota bacterium]|nr:MlaD family protein [Myxococcota bacterium]